MYPKNNPPKTEMEKKIAKVIESLLLSFIFNYQIIFKF
jgi:hypothetical protein